MNKPKKEPTWYEALASVEEVCRKAGFRDRQHARTTVLAARYRLEPDFKIPKLRRTVSSQLGGRSY